MENDIIGVSYKPPNTDGETFNEQLNQRMHTIRQERKYAFIMDYNVNLGNHDKHSLTGAHLNMIVSKNIRRHTAHTIASRLNHKQWQMGHTSDLMMIIS